MVTEQPYPHHRYGHDDDPSGGGVGPGEGAEHNDGVPAVDTGSGPAAGGGSGSGPGGGAGSGRASSSGADAGEWRQPTEWLRFGRARQVPFALFDEETGQRLQGRAERAAWNEACAGGVPPAPEPVDESVVPALPPELLEAMGWQAVEAPRWDADDEVIREYLGPAPTAKEAAEIAKDFGWDCEDPADDLEDEFDEDWVKQALFTEPTGNDDEGGFDDDGSEHGGFDESEYGENGAFDDESVSGEVVGDESGGSGSASGDGSVPNSDGGDGGDRGGEEDAGLGAGRGRPSGARAGAGRWAGGDGGADRLAHADPDPVPRGWPRPADGGGLPVGVAPRRDGQRADVGAHARRGADWQALYDLENLDVAATDPYTLVEAVAAWGRQEALAGYHQRMLAFELAHRPQNLGGPREFEAAAQVTNPVAAVEVAFRLGVTRQRARRLIDAGTAMAQGSGILVGVALQQGEIDAAKADLIIERTAHLPMELALDVHDEVLSGARLRTYPQVERDVNRAVARVDPEEFSERHDRARTGRHVSAPRALPDGMASMRFVTSAADAMALHTALEAAARTAKNGGDGRTLDQLRADVLATMGHTALATGHIGPCPGHKCADDHESAGTGGGTEDATGAHTGPCDAPEGGTGDDAEAGQGASSTDQNVDDTPPPRADRDAPDAEADAGAGANTAPGAGAGGRSAEPGARAGADADAGAEGAQPSTEPDSAQPDAAAHTGPGEAFGPTGPGTSADPGIGTGTGAGSGCDPAAHPPAGVVLTPFTLGAVGGARAQVRITVPLSTLMGTSNEAGDLEGYGPIPAEVARAWAAGGTWKRLVTDPLTERAIEVTAKRYEPPDWLREQVIANEPFCTAPGCNTHARHTDLDHGVAFPEGPTTESNLHPLCRHHHQLKTDGHLDYASPEPGVHQWTTPSGHCYRIDLAGTHLIPPEGEAEPDAEGAMTGPRRGPPVDSASPHQGAYPTEDDPPPF